MTSVEGPVTMEEANEVHAASILSSRAVNMDIIRSGRILCKVSVRDSFLSGYTMRLVVEPKEERKYFI